MVRNRLLLLVGVFLLGASAALADDVGFVDCSSHSDGTQVFAKASKTQDIVASVPCGERFTILVYGFIFSRVQTSDGKIGYVYSNVISVDRTATAVQKQPSAQVVTASEKTPVYKPRTPDTTASVAPSAPAVAKPVQSAPAQVAPADTTAAAAQPVQVAATQASPTAAFASGSSVLEKTVTGSPSAPSAATQSEPAARAESAAVQPAATQVAAVQSAPAQETVTIPNAPERTAAVAQPDPPAPAQPEPAKAQPASAAVEPVQPTPRPVEARASWEKPLPPSLTHMPLIELFGGYSFARFDNGAGNPASNLNGAMGSFGYNFRPWLQIVGDTSYNFVTTNGIKTVIYGNHYGARYFYHKENRWHLTPFVEGLVGGSRADTSISGTGGYTTSDNCISFKAGGGVDFRPSRRWEIRLLNVDYYRTAFGTNLHQNNYWASAGVVLRLFAGGRE